MNLHDPASVEEVEDGGEEVCELAVVIHKSTTDLNKKVLAKFQTKNPLTESVLR